MNTVEPIELYPNCNLPYIVKVNGRALTRAWPQQHIHRRFKDSFSAALAGARYVDVEIRPSQSETEGDAK